MKKSLLFLLIFSLCALSACQNGSQTGEINPGSTEPAATSAGNGISYSLIANGQIKSPQNGQEYTLTEGKYEGGSESDYVLIQLLPQYAVGDLNGDGKEDIAVVAAENFGGSGVFDSLVVFLADGNGVKQSDGVLIDDRPVINSLSIAGGVITLDAVIHGANDPMVSPSLKVIEKYQLYGNVPTLVGSSQTSDGVEQSIQIDSPADLSNVNGQVEVKGSMPVSPFENTLRFRFFNGDGLLLNEGSFLVKSEDIGKPATIDESLALPDVPSGSRLRLELAYLSAKDGSVVCMASVNLVVK